MSSGNGSQSGADARGKTVRLTVGQAIVRYLQVQWSERDGVRRPVIPAMFGIFGHGNVCGLGQALEEDNGGLPYYQPKNEQAMVHTAIGFAKLNDRLATLACTASIGPGATNMITGAATATVNRIPVLLFPSDTFATRLQGPPMQALDNPMVGDLTVNDCFRPVSRFFDRITRPEQILSSLPEAMRTLLDPEQTGAVTVCLHQDVQAEAYDFPVRFFEPRTWQVSRRPPAPDEVRLAVEMLSRAERPLIIAGGGVHYSGARAVLRKFADRFGVPVSETSAGKGAMDGGQMSVGAIGHSGTRAANDLAREADLIVCLGTRLMDLTTGSHTLFQAADVKFIGINVSAADAHKLGASPMVADARLALEALDSALSAANWATPPSWQSRVGEVKAKWEQDLADDLAARPGERMSQGQVLQALNQTIAAEDVLVVASGTPHVDVHKIWDANRCARVLMEVGFSCMGHEIPAALGARMARGSTGEVYAVIGDGTYLMGHTELVTAVQERLKITVVIFENQGFQSIHALQRSRTGRSFGLEFRERDSSTGQLSGPVLPIDFAASARSYGCAAFEARSIEEFVEAVKRASAETRPVVIVAHTEPHRLTLDSGCWWDVGVAQVSGRPETQIAAGESNRGRALQRVFA